MALVALRKKFFLPFSKFIEQRQEHGKHEGFFFSTLRLVSLSRLPVKETQIKFFAASAI